MFELRPYQTEAVSAILREWEAGRRKTLLVIPTGGGKTCIMASVAQHQVEEGQKVLILAHRGELLTQARDKLKAFTNLDSALEKAESTAIGADEQIVVGSIQTMSQDERLQQFPRDYFQTIMVDEAHHCLSDTYQKVLDHFCYANVLGVTATPDRGDMKNLGMYFQSMAYEYSLAQAIKDGYLSKIRCQMIPLQIDITKVTVNNGDYAIGEIGHVIDPYLEEIAQEMVQYCKGHHTVVFLPLIETSQRFVKILENVGLSAAEVNGTSKDRNEITKRFERGEIDVLCNAMLLTEGWDCPCVDRVVVLRPTKVRALYSQMVGRGTRLYPGKESLMVLDFLWMTERHDLCRPSCLIARDEILAKHVDKKMQEGMDLIEAEFEVEKDAIAEREESLAKQLDEMRKKHKKLVDPIQYAYSIYDSDLVDYVPAFAWEQQEPTDKQKKALEDFGINPDAVSTKGQAAILLKKVWQRQDQGYASPKQIRILERFGFRRVADWAKDEATRMTRRVIHAGWAVPKGVNPATYHGKTPYELAIENGEDPWTKTY